MVRLTPASGPSPGRKVRRKQWQGLTFVSPWLLGFLVFTLYPILASLYFSFCRFNILQPPRWVGADNYRALVWGDPEAWKAVGNTAFMFLELPIGLVLGISLALLLNQRVRGQNLFRTVVYVPAVLPAVTTALLWLWIFNPQYGLLNRLLDLAGIQGPGWVVEARWAKPAFILMDLWGVGSTTVIFLAALQAAPAHLYEAAQVDGAGVLAQFRHVTLPALSPTILFLTITGMIGLLQYFTQTFIMTKGGPENSTLFYGLYLFENAFEYFRMGYACAMAWVLFLVAAAATWITFRSSARWVYYGGEG